MADAKSPTDSGSERVSVEVRDRARELWTQGVAASEAGDFQGALDAFQRAYSLIPHPATLRNLGLMELETGRFVDAARHLAAYLQSGLTDSPEVVRGIEEKLESAERMVGRLVLRIRPRRSVVIVDGEQVPESLRQDTWHVSPGRHIVEARLEGGRSATREVVVPVAESREVAIDLSAPPKNTRVRAARRRSAPPVPEPSKSESEPNWSEAKFWTVVGTSSLALASLGVGIYGSIRFETLSDDADALRADARRSLDGANPCASEAGAAARVCTRLENTTDHKDQAGLMANLGWIGAGVFGVTAAATWLLWPDQPASAAQGGSPLFAVWGGPGEAGAALSGSF